MSATPDQSGASVATSAWHVFIREDLAMLRRRLVISGRVQGVWFRVSCRQEADAAQVAGWARNLPDGRVEVVLEGSAEAVARVESWCHSGPRHAVVTAVVGEDEDPTGAYGFDII